MFDVQADCDEAWHLFKRFAHQLATKHASHAMALNTNNDAGAAAARHAPAPDNVQQTCNNGSDAIEACLGISKAPACTLPSQVGHARVIIKTLIKELVECVAMGSAMPADGKHRQHLSQWLRWQRAGAGKKGLQLDCAGLSLAVYCLAQTMAADVPVLRTVALVVRFTDNHLCLWFTLV